MKVSDFIPVPQMKQLHSLHMRNRSSANCSILLKIIYIVMVPFPLLLAD